MNHGLATLGRKSKSEVKPANVPEVEARLLPSVYAVPRGSTTSITSQCLRWLINSRKLQPLSPCTLWFNGVGLLWCDGPKNFARFYMSLSNNTDKQMTHCDAVDTRKNFRNVKRISFLFPWCRKHLSIVFFVSCENV